MLHENLHIRGANFIAAVDNIRGVVRSSHHLVHQGSLRALSVSTRVVPNAVATKKSPPLRVGLNLLGSKGREPPCRGGEQILLVPKRDCM